MKVLKIRTSLFLRMAVASCIIIAVVAVAIDWFIITPWADNLAENELEEMSGSIQGDVRDFFVSVERQLYVAQDYVQDGLVPDNDAVAFKRVFSPLSAHHKALATVRWSRDDSRELALFKDDAGWEVRSTFPARYPGVADWLYWDEGGKLLPPRQAVSGYDCRTRTWFAGAMNSPGKVFWTAPFLPLRSNEPTMTVAMQYRDRSAGLHVISIDVLLSEVSVLTRSVRFNYQAHVAVFDETGMVVGLPGGNLPIERTLASNTVWSVPKIGLPYLQDGYAKWLEKKEPLTQSIGYSSGGEPWLTRVAPLVLGEKKFYIGVFAPRDQFDQGRKVSLLTLGVLLLMALLSAAVLANETARRLSTPLRQLLGQSERISRLDFRPDEFTPSPWAEINQLAGAQELMRRLLCESQENMEEKVRSRTFELHKLTRAMEQSPVSFVITDINGTIEYVNPYFYQLTGYSADEVLGTNQRIIKSGATSPQFYKEFWSFILSGAVWNGEILNKKKNGELYWEKMVVSPIMDDTGQITHFVAVKEDVTELRQKGEELIQARLAAEAATEAKSMFLANMSHEIRTPMNAIIGMSYLALKTELTDKQRDYIRKINNAGTSLLHIINDILDFSKIEAHSMSLEKIDFYLDDVLRGVVDVTSAKAYDKGLEFLCHIPPDLPVSLIGDPLRLGQVITNLVNNALKFTDRGEVAIEVKPLQRSEARVQLQFTVRDTGIGLSPDAADQLFQPFIQADGSTTRKYGGTGLGLSISKQLVEMMEGTIWVDSQPGAGSRFCFTAWFGISDTKLQQRRVIPAELNNLRLLVVDDNPTAREILTEYLQSMGFRADAADSGEAALAAVNNAGSDPYGVVFMDWRMPGMDGIQTARILRKNQENGPVPAIVMVSAFDREELHAQVGQLHLAGVLIKPVSESALIDTLMHLYAPAKETISNQALQNENYGLDGMKVLLAEDNSINRQIAVELLESQGVSVDVAENGREAVDQFLAVPDRYYDVVLMDLQMPVMDGLAATREIRKVSADVPVIAFTARAMAGERELCLAAGMNGHVMKPVDPQILFTTLQPWKKSGDAAGSELPGPAGLQGIGPSDTPLGSIAGIDLEDGLRRVAHNAKLYLRLITQFVDGYGDAAGQLAAAWRDKDSDLTIRLAHSIKGVAGNLGAVALQDAAAAIETVLTHTAREPSRDMPALLAQFEARLREVVAGIQGYLGKPAAAVAGREPVVDLSIARSCEILRAFLLDADSEAVEFFASARGTFLSAYDRGRILELEKALNDFNFDLALERLNRLEPDAR